MNINNIKNTFDKYVQTFNTADSNIMRKIIHSYNVAKNAYNIARSLNLDEENVNLASAIGYFHDIARFEQWEQFKTYKDKLSFDHGDEALNILFKQNLIKNFNIDKKYYNIISFCIKNHNKFNILEKDLEGQFKDEFFTNEQMMLHAKIIRDADKLDLYRIMAKGNMPSFNSEYKEGGISDKVLASFIKKEPINSKFIKTFLDVVLMQICLVYDFNYQYTKQIYLKKNYNNAVLNNYKSKLSKEQSEIIQSTIKNYM